ncbi:hypothetical protein D3C85_1876670 [compost metagenome]
MQGLGSKACRFQLFSQVLGYVLGTAKRTATDQSNVCHEMNDPNLLKVAALYAVNRLGSTCG